MFQFTCPVVEKQVVLKRICKICHSSNVIIKQTCKKSLKDSVVGKVTVLRLKCKACKYSFRCYPEGVREYSSRSKRLVFLGVLLYSAGLSYEKACGFLNGMVGKNLQSFVTIWRDVQVVSEKLRRRKIISPRLCTNKNIIVGMDGTYVRVKGKEQPVILATNAENGTTITVALGNEWREKELRVFLKEVTKEIGMKHIKGLVTDDLNSYKALSERQKLPHQVCVAHVRKNMENRLRKLEKKIPESYIQNVENILENRTVSLVQTIKTDPKLWNHSKKTCKS